MSPRRADVEPDDEPDRAPTPPRKPAPKKKKAAQPKGAAQKKRAVLRNAHDKDDR